jgi:hypothetical protein
MLTDPAGEEGRGLALVRTFAIETVVGDRPGGGAYVSVILPVWRSRTSA